jgi:hypothetical protein
MEKNKEESKPKLWKTLNFWFGIIGIIGFLFSIFTYIYTAKPDLKYNLLANTSVLDVKEAVNKLSVTYDSINILESNQNISIILLEIKNEGDKNITLNDFDQRSQFGIKIIGGRLLKKPELITSSDNDYFKDVILNYSKDDVKFKYKLIDTDQYFRIKLLVLHPKKNIPIVKPIGKISGMNKIDVTSFIELKSVNNAKEKLILLFCIFFSLIILITILLFIISGQKKNNSALFFEFIKLKEAEAALSAENTSKLKNILEFESVEKLPNDVAKAESIGDLLTFEETINLKEGMLVYHNRFGRGKIIRIEKGKVEKDSKGEIHFDIGGTKRLLLRFAVLYKLKE